MKKNNNKEERKKKKNRKRGEINKIKMQICMQKNQQCFKTLTSLFFNYNNYECKQLCSKCV